MKTNSRATNLRHLQDALAALSHAATAARLARAASAAPSPTPLPPSPENDLGVRAAARAAARVGATHREIAGAAMLSVSWARVALVDYSGAGKGGAR